MNVNERIQTGIPGLDHVLGGGLRASSIYLLRGASGTGKTTLGLQFVLEGVRRGERCLYLTLSETRGQLDMIARSYGWTLEGVEIHDLARRDDADERRSAYTVFRPAEVELEELSRAIQEQLARVQPARLVLDALSELRLLSDAPFRYRRELIALSDRALGCNCTGWLLDTDADGNMGGVAETLVSGVVDVQQLAPAYGGVRRRLRVRKLRASRTVGGYHDFAIGDGGVEVYPRLVAAPYRNAHASGQVPSGIGELDALLGGGLERGTSTVLMGPAGTGKSTIAAQFVAAAAARGEAGVMFCFDESPTNLLIRARGLGIPLAEQVEAGEVQLVPVDPAELTPGELSHRIRLAVGEGARMVVVDSLNGYLNAMLDERFLSAHLHELLAYLSEQGVVTLLPLAQRGFFGGIEAPVDISYVADTVIFFRYYETAGEVKQAISVLKKRTGLHERTIRELQFGPQGVRIGRPLPKFHGVLTGNPVYVNGDLQEGEHEPSQ